LYTGTTTDRYGDFDVVVAEVILPLALKSGSRLHAAHFEPRQYSESRKASKEEGEKVAPPNRSGSPPSNLSEIAPKRYGTYGLEPGACFDNAHRLASERTPARIEKIPSEGPCIVWDGKRRSSEKSFRS
jgi:hypothetical protein